MNEFSRSEALIGNSGQTKLKNSKVIIVGCGGVGGYAAEFLVRSGIGSFTFVDYDSVEITNLNRQIIGLRSALGQSKADLLQARARDINRAVNAVALNCAVTAENAEQILSADRFDYCIDAIDRVKDKIELICACEKLNIPCISALGAGNRLIADFAVKDIYATSHDPLAKAIRSKLRKKGIVAHKTVCARTLPEVSAIPVASISYAPAAMACVLAQEVLKDLLSCA